MPASSSKAIHVKFDLKTVLICAADACVCGPAILRITAAATDFLVAASCLTGSGILSTKAVWIPRGKIVAGERELSPTKRPYRFCRVRRDGNTVGSKVRRDLERPALAVEILQRHPALWWLINEIPVDFTQRQTVPDKRNKVACFGDTKPAMRRMFMIDDDFRIIFHDRHEDRNELDTLFSGIIELVAEISGVKLSRI